MAVNSTQENVWKGNFGKEYTDRNIYDRSALDEFYTDIYGITRTDMNKRFIGNLDKSIKVLEIGSNVGNQLLCLQEMGFGNLYGIELQEYAVELSKSKTKGINIIQGSAFDIPFKDNFFDLVFTSGVLIHISPENLSQILSEAVRCSKNYIWGFEYFSKNLESISYRGNQDLLWKGNYAESYIKQFQELKHVKKENFKYVKSNNEDQMFLLQKK